MLPRFLICFALLIFMGCRETNSLTVYEPEWALPVHVEFEGPYAQSVAKIFPMDAVLAATKNLAPARNHFFKWESERESLSKKELRLVFTDSEGDLAHDFLGDRISATYEALPDSKSKKTVISLVVALDRVFDKGSDAIANAIAGELYGEVQRLLEIDDCNCGGVL